MRRSMLLLALAAASQLISESASAQLVGYPDDWESVDTYKVGGNTFFFGAKSSEGHVTYRVQIAESGVYLLKAHVLAETGSSNSFFVSSSGGTPSVWNIPPSSESQWQEFGPLFLQKGTQLIRFGVREASTAISDIEIKLRSDASKRAMDVCDQDYEQGTYDHPECWAPPCSEAELEALLAPACGPDGVDPREKVSCSVRPGTLRTGTAITKQIWLEGAAASHVFIDCGGATLAGGLAQSKSHDFEPSGLCRNYSIESSNRQALRVTSRHIPGSDPTFASGWETAHHIVVRNCDIRGHIQVMGIDNGSADGLSASDPCAPSEKSRRCVSSRRANHTANMRKAAPHSITFQNVAVTSLGTSHLYVDMGAQRVRLLDSTLGGVISKKTVSVYLDAEGHSHEIVGNTFRPTFMPTNENVEPRELIAIDGSSHNIIRANLFRLESFDFQNAWGTFGGIGIYRNCGEKLIARHEKPRHNEIVNNLFEYDLAAVGSAGPKRPAVWNGLRDRETCAFTLDKSDFVYGSGPHPRDFARNNVIAHNRFVFRNGSPPSSWSPIRLTRRDLNDPVYVHANKESASSTSRPSACFMDTSFKYSMLPHGMTSKIVSGSSTAPRCEVVRCDDGKIESVGTCSMRRVNANCKSGDSERCYSLSCGRDEIIGLTVACDLRSGAQAVSSSDFESVQPSTMRVLREAAQAEQGHCRADRQENGHWRLDISRRDDIPRGRAGSREVEFRCANEAGGGCAIRARAFCSDAL